MNTCTNCGQSVAIDRQSCDRCGAPMAAAVAPGVVMPPAPPQPQWQPTPPPPAPGTTQQWAQPGGTFGDPSSGSPSSGSTPIETGSEQFAQPSSAKPRRSLMVTLLVVGALVVTAVAFLAVRSFSGSDRGEANPDDAVNTMIASIADENPVELVNSIAPSELSFFGDVEAAAANTVDGDGVAADSLEERGITINGEDLVPGLTLELADLTYVVEEKSDDVAKVTVNSVSGNWTFDPKVLLDAVDLDQLTGGEVTEEDALEDIEEADISGGSFDLDDLDFTDEGVFFMAVREDGGWFVSPMYTLLEYVVEVQDLPEGDFDEPVVTGAATPQEAVEQSVSAVFAFAIEGDFSGIIDSLPPNRYAALYAYRDALEELTGREGIEDAERLDIDVDVQEIQEFDDERGLGVTIDKASVEMTADGGDRTVRFEIDGKCAMNTRIEDGDEDTQEFCLDDFGEGAGPFEDGIPGIDKFWVIVTEDDGQFFVDPLASLGSYIAAANVQQIADDVSEMIEEQAEDDVDDTDPTEPADATDTTDGSATTEPAGTDG